MVNKWAIFVEGILARLIEGSLRFPCCRITRCDLRVRLLIFKIDQQLPKGHNIIPIDRGEQAAIEWLDILIRLFSVRDIEVKDIDQLFGTYLPTIAGIGDLVGVRILPPEILRLP